jgi:hypothetical protein
LLNRHKSGKELNEADKLAIAMMNVPDYMLRLKCLLFSSEFDGRDGEFVDI